MILPVRPRYIKDTLSGFPTTKGRQVHLIEDPLDGHWAWKLGVTSESQNNPVSTNGVNSAMAQSVRILRKITKDLKS